MAIKHVEYSGSDVGGANRELVSWLVNLYSWTLQYLTVYASPKLGRSLSVEANVVTATHLAETHERPQVSVAVASSQDTQVPRGSKPLAFSSSSQGLTMKAGS